MWTLLNLHPPLEDVDGWAESLLPFVILFTSSWLLGGGGALSGASPTTSNSTSRSSSSLPARTEIYSEVDRHNKRKADLTERRAGVIRRTYVCRTLTRSA